MVDYRHKYDAFIVYSHAEDVETARALESALSRFGKAWYALRSLRIFRDLTSLAANPALWSSLVQALDDSSYLILLASPSSARSAWVDREVSHFISRRGLESILIVVTAGELVWDEGSKEVGAISNVLPPSLRMALKVEPRWIDLRWINSRSASTITLQDPGFLDAIASIAAVLHGVAKDDLVGENVEQHRRTMRMARSAITSLFALTLAATTATVVAIAQRNTALHGAPHSNTSIIAIGVAVSTVIAIVASGLSLAALAGVRKSRSRRVRISTKEPEGQKVEGSDLDAKALLASRVADEVAATLTRPFRRLLQRPIDVYIGPTSETEQERTAQLAGYIANLGRGRAYRGRLRVVVDRRLASDTRDLKNSYKRAARAQHFIFVCTRQTLQSPAATFILQEWLRGHPSQNVMAVIASQDVNADEFSSLLDDTSSTDLPEITNVFDLTNYYSVDRKVTAKGNMDGIVLLLSRILRVEPYWIESGKKPALVLIARKRSRIEEPLLPWNIADTLDFASRAQAAVQLPEVTAAATVMGIGRLNLLAELIAEQGELIGKYLTPVARRELLKAEKNAEREVSVRLGRRSNVSRTRGGVILLALSSALVTTALFAKLLYDILAGDFNKVAMGACTASAVICLVASLIARWHDSELSRQRAINRRYERSQYALRHELGRHLQDDVILPHLRLFLNRKISSNGEGIRHVYDSAVVTTQMQDRFRLQTRALRRIYGQIQTPGGASIGLAGPRGVGKTSILAALCRTMYADHPGESGSQFGVVIPAPIEYQSEPFTAQILASICREVLIIDTHRSAVGPYHHATNLPHHRRIYSLIVAVVAMVGLLVINDKFQHINPLVKSILLAGLCVVAFVSALLPSTYIWYLQNSLLYSRATNGVLVARSTRRRRRDISKVAQDILKWLFYKEEQSRVMGSSTSAYLGISLTANRTLKLEGKPWSTPELVHQFRDFVRLITSAGYRVLIGIDELDKIDDDEQAIRLLNDIKALFGVEDCYFLVSVSMSAVAKFEQRGLPFQDAFESALDEVIRVDPLSTDETIELLQRRLIGIPYSYAILCHIVAGGLPRDILRAVRDLFGLDREVQGSSTTVERQFIINQIVVKVKAAQTRYQISNVQPDEQLRLVRSLTSGPVDEEAWTNALVTALSEIGAEDIGSLRTILYTFWALTVHGFIDTFDERSAEPTKRQLSLSDELARIRLLLSHDLVGAVESLNFVRKELGLSQLSSPVLIRRN